jgi:SSS family solute:Na+ symporter
MMAVVTAVWFTWGGIRDIRRLFSRLAREKVNHLDDGSVVNHQNLDETARIAEAPHVLDPVLHD